MKHRKYGVRIILSILAFCETFILSVSGVHAISQTGTAATAVIGQPNLEGCATGWSGGTYAQGLSSNGAMPRVYDGKLIVPDGNTYRVLIYNTFPTSNNPTPDVVIGHNSICTRFPSLDPREAYQTPISVVYDGTNFLVSDWNKNRIEVFQHGIPTTNGQRGDIVIGQANDTDYAANQGGTANANTLYGPYTMQIVNGKLFVADRSNNRVLIYNHVPTQTNAAADVVVGQPDMTSSSINTGGISARTLNNPRGVFVYNGKLIISDSENNRVLIFNTIPESNNAAADVVIGQTLMNTNTANNGGLSEMTLSKPYDVHVDVNGKLYIADYNNHRVLIYNSIPENSHAAANVVIGQADFTHNAANRGGSVAANTLYSPGGVTTYNGKLIVGDILNSRVLIFNTIPSSNGVDADIVVGQKNMTSNAQYQITGVTGATLAMPQKLSYDGHHLFVGDYANHRLLIFNTPPKTSGVTADAVVGQPDMNTTTSGVSANRLAAWFVGGGFSDGTRLYVADTLNNRILLYNTIPTNNNASADFVLGQSLMTTNTANNGGVSASSLNNPQGGSVEGTQFAVADMLNHRVLIFNGVPTQNKAAASVVIGQPDMASSIPNNGNISARSLQNPSSVFLKNGRVFITDRSNHRVLIYNSIPTSDHAAADIVIGQPDMNSNLPNAGGSISSRSLYYPRSVFVDDNNTIYIADSQNARVLVFKGIPTENYPEASAVIGQNAFTTNLTDGRTTGLDRPNDMVVADGYLYIADNINDRIMVYPVGPHELNASIANLVNTKNITAQLAAIDAREVMVSEQSDFSGASWQPFTSSFPFTLSDGDGSKNLYVKFRDYALYEGNPLTLTTTLDTSIPSILISDIGKISSIPNKQSLFFYFTSQTPLIKGTTEPLATVHFVYNNHDYTAVADAQGAYTLQLPELPRTRCSFTYRATDAASNTSEQRSLTLVIGEENFPVSSSETSPTPIPSGSVTPTPQPSDNAVYTFTVTDASGKPLVYEVIHVGDQRYVTDGAGKLYVDKNLAASDTVTVEREGKQYKGTILGDKVTVTFSSTPAPSAIPSSNVSNAVCWILPIVLLLVSGAIYLSRRKHET